MLVSSVPLNVTEATTGASLTGAIFTIAFCVTEVVPSLVLKLRLTTPLKFAAGVKVHGPPLLPVIVP